MARIPVSATVNDDCCTPSPQKIRPRAQAQVCGAIAGRMGCMTQTFLVSPLLRSVLVTAEVRCTTPLSSLHIALPILRHRFG